MEANSVDPDQTAPIGAVWSGSTLFDVEGSKIFWQRSKADDNQYDWHFKALNKLLKKKENDLFYGLFWWHVIYFMYIPQ